MLPTAPLCSWAGPPGRWLTPPGISAGMGLPGAAHAAACHVCSPFPAVQARRSWTRSLRHSGSSRAVGCWRHALSTRLPPPSSCRFSSPPGAVSCMSPRWWWKVCSARTPAPCGSGAEALTMRDLCHPTSSEALPSEPPHPPANFGNKHGPEPRTGVLCRAHAQGPLSSPWTERAGLSSGPACPSSEAAAPCRLWWLRISTQTEPRRDKHGKKLTYIYYVYCILIQSPFPVIT